MRLLDLVAPAAPPVCVACGGWAGAAEPLCRVCREQMTWLSAEAVDGVWAPVAYAGPARAVVAALKFRGAVRVADAMAAAVVAGAPVGWLSAESVLVPVPLHAARRRRRGFNQAERLAWAVGRRTGVDVSDILVRGGSRATQMGRGREERLAGISGSVAVRGRAPAPVVLVDDVVTTGATLSAAAAALRSAGAEVVAAAVVASTPKLFGPSVLAPRERPAAFP
jgi:ComF family protein